MKRFSLKFIIWFLLCLAGPVLSSEEPAECQRLTAALGAELQKLAGLVWDQAKASLDSDQRFLADSLHDEIELLQSRIASQGLSANRIEKEVSQLNSQRRTEEALKAVPVHRATVLKESEEAMAEERRMQSAVDLVNWLAPYRQSSAQPSYPIATANQRVRGALEARWVAGIEGLIYLARRQEALKEVLNISQVPTVDWNASWGFRSDRTRSVGNGAISTLASELDPQAVRELLEQIEADGESLEVLAKYEKYDPIMLEQFSRVSEVRKMNWLFERVLNSGNTGLAQKVIAAFPVNWDWLRQINVSCNPDLMKTAIEKGYDVVKDSSFSVRKLYAMEYENTTVGGLISAGNHKALEAWVKAGADLSGLPYLRLLFEQVLPRKHRLSGRFFRPYQVGDLTVRRSEFQKLMEINPELFDAKWRATYQILKQAGAL